MEEQMTEYRKKQREKFSRTKGHQEVAEKRKKRPIESVDIRDVSSKSLTKCARTKEDHVSKGRVVEVSGASPKKLRNLVSTSDASVPREASEARKSGDNEKTTVQNRADSSGLTSSDSIVDLQNDFSIATWNVDGLEEEGLKARTLAAIQTVRAKNLVVVFLQEVVEASLLLFKKYLGAEYKFFEPSSAERIPYFCVILINQKHLSHGSLESRFFPGSMMGRHFLLLEVAPIKFPNDKILLMTTHLESTREHSIERISQFKAIMNRISSAISSKTPPAVVICGGDLNIRDKEVKEAGVPSGVRDAWVDLGSPDSSKFTWDTLKNSNKEIGTSYKPRYRFDRLYYASPKLALKDTAGTPAGWTPKSVCLIGSERVDSINMFPSDHFGVQVVFKKASE